MPVALYKCLYHVITGNDVLKVLKALKKFQQRTLLFTENLAYFSLFNFHRLFYFLLVISLMNTFF